MARQQFVLAILQVLFFASAIYNVVCISSCEDQLHVYETPDFVMPEATTKTIMQRRDNSTDFNKNWTEYKNGFGDLCGNYFIGLEELYKLTNSRPVSLIVYMRVNGTDRFASYNQFAIGGESEMYKLKTLGKYIGNAGDSLTYHLGMKFSTHDVDNDLWSTGSCAKLSGGGWWYKYCHRCNLNGVFGSTESYKAVTWNTMSPKPLQAVRMLIYY